MKTKPDFSWHETRAPLAYFSETFKPQALEAPAMRQQITGLDAHPERDALRAYEAQAPEGLWTGRLDHLAWGRASNLLCYFTDEATGHKYRLSVFSRQEYKPYQGEVAFDEEAPGGRFEITTEKSKRSDLPKFLLVRKL